MTNNTNAEVPELIQTIGVKLFPNFSNQLEPKKIGHKKRYISKAENKCISQCFATLGCRASKQVENRQPSHGRAETSGRFNKNGFEFRIVP